MSSLTSTRRIFPDAVMGNASTKRQTRGTMKWASRIWRKATRSAGSTPGAAADGELQHLYREAQIATIYGGTSEVLRGWSLSAGSSCHAEGKLGGRDPRSRHCVRSGPNRLADDLHM